MSKRKPTFIVPLKSAKLLKSDKRESCQEIRNIKNATTLETESTDEESYHVVPNEIFPNKGLKNKSNKNHKKSIESLDISNKVNTLQPSETLLTNSLALNCKNQYCSPTPYSGIMYAFNLYLQNSLNIKLL